MVSLMAAAIDIDSETHLKEQDDILDVARKSCFEGQDPIGCWRVVQSFSGKSIPLRYLEFVQIRQTMRYCCTEPEMNCAEIVSEIENKLRV